MKLQFISVLTPLATLENHYPGGLPQCLEDFGPENGESVEIADGLLRVSTMSPADTKAVCDAFEAKGLRGIVDLDGKEIWQDFCVVDYIMGVTLPCPWIKFDPATEEVFLAEARNTIPKSSN